MKSIRCFAAALAFVLSAAAGADERRLENKLPAAVVAALEKGDEVELLSLDGDTDNPNGWHGAKVLGKAPVEKADRRAVASALRKGVDEGKDGARCFIPRHGVRATHAGKTYDLLICFECHWLYIYSGNSDRPLVLVTSDAPQKVLNNLLSDAKVPLARPEKQPIEKGK